MRTLGERLGAMESTAVQRQAFGNVIVGFALACICVLATSVSEGGGPITRPVDPLLGTLGV